MFSILDSYIPVLGARRRGGLGGLISFFIRVVIYDICITGIQEVLGVNRWIALFIFLALLLGVGLVGYMLKQRMSPGVED